MFSAYVFKCVILRLDCFCDMKKWRDMKIEQVVYEISILRNALKWPKNPPNKLQTAQHVENFSRTCRKANIDRPTNRVNCILSSLKQSELGQQHFQAGQGKCYVYFPICIINYNLFVILVLAKSTSNISVQRVKAMLIKITLDHLSLNCKASGRRIN